MKAIFSSKIILYNSFSVQYLLRISLLANNFDTDIAPKKCFIIEFPVRISKSSFTSKMFYFRVHFENKMMSSFSLVHWCATWWLNFQSCRKSWSFNAWLKLIKITQTEIRDLRTGRSKLVRWSLTQIKVWISLINSLANPMNNQLFSARDHKYPCNIIHIKRIHTVPLAPSSVQINASTF